MKVLVLDPVLPVNERLSIIHTEINEGYEAMQEVIGGMAEFLTVFINDNEYDFIFDEEGKYKQELLPNIALMHNGGLRDIVLGKVIVSKADDEGRQVDLTEDDIQNVLNYFINSGKIISDKGFELLTFTL